MNKFIKWTDDHPFIFYSILLVLPPALLTFLGFPDDYSGELWARYPCGGFILFYFINFFLLALVWMIFGFIYIDLFDEDCGYFRRQK